MRGVGFRSTPIQFCRSTHNAAANLSIRNYTVISIYPQGQVQCRVGSFGIARNRSNCTYPRDMWCSRYSQYKTIVSEISDASLVITAVLDGDESPGAIVLTKLMPHYYENADDDITDVGKSCPSERTLVCFLTIGTNISPGRPNSNMRGIPAILRRSQREYRE